MTQAAKAAQAPVETYANACEHLADELVRLDLLLQWRIAEFRMRTQAFPATGQQQIYISHGEADALLQQGTPTAPDAPELKELDVRLARQQRMVEARVAASLSEGCELPLHQLGRIFGLSSFELDVVLVCLAPELDRKYDRLYAYLQDDITRKKPSIDLALNLLFDTPAERWQARSVFADASRLFRFGLLQAHDDPQSPSGSSDMACFLKLDPRIAGFLLGDPRIDGRLTGIARLVWPAETTDEMQADLVLAERLVRLVERHCRPDSVERPLLLYLQGPYGIGKNRLALEICRRLACPLLRIDTETLFAGPGDAEIRAAFREGPLNQAALYLDSCDTLLAEDERARASLKRLAHVAREYGWLVFLAGTRPWTPPGETFTGMAFQSVELPAADTGLREAIWRSELARLKQANDPALAGGLALRFRLTPGQIRDASADAARQNTMDDNPAQLGIAELAAACRRQSNQKLTELAQKIEPAYGWEDLVLPADRLAPLYELCGQVRQHYRVFYDWGFARKLARGRGVSALFSGPPGTGKTLAAEVIARDLGLDLYRIDLSQMVSKYIGETEKNLQRIFREAETSNAILFFDEADALFGKRTEVSDAHDRYANIETSYLLQRMEDYTGVVILASNLRENMDPAFTRRLRFIVEFPFPDEESRALIWQTHLPAQAPRSETLDFPALARKYPLAGGNIKNIVLRAAFLAAEEGAAIGTGQVLRAARREYEQMGRLWSEG